MAKKDLIPYETDASMIEGTTKKVVFPQTASEIQKIIKEESNITIRGGGTGLAGGAVPNDSIVLDLSKMNKISNLNIQEKTIDVEAGVILDELNNYLSSYNLEFPIQPSSHSVCTIGGMIATNAAGSRVIKYGKTKKWVEEIAVIDGKAEIIKIKKADLEDFCGMEGITGVIIKARLNITEKKKRTASIFVVDSISDVVNKTEELKKDKEISEIEFLDKITSVILGFEDKYHLIAEFESDKGEFKDERYQELMKLRDNVYPSLASIGYTHIEDPEIMLGKFEELAIFLEQEKIPYFGHLSVGIIHPVFMKNQKNKIQKMFLVVKRVKGNISGEHGIGISKKEFVEQLQKKLFERVKRRHDPACKLNCGKII